MAELATYRPVTIPGCRPPQTEPCFIENIYDDGRGRIRNCRPPFECIPWPPKTPIPEYWDEPPPLPLTKERDPCFTTITATPQQLAAVSLPRPGAPLAPRLPREPRQARAPRTPRTPRPPRGARAPRKPRRPRRARAARARTRPPQTPRPPRKSFYCEYVTDPKTKQLENIAKTGPWSDEQINKVRAQLPTHIFTPVARHGTCPNANSSACASQAAAIVRPLQELLGWKRDTIPTPEELKQKRRATQSRPRPKETAIAPLQPVPPPGPAVPVHPPGTPYLCYDPRITPPFYRPQATPCVPPQVPYPE